MFLFLLSSRELKNDICIKLVYTFLLISYLMYSLLFGPFLVSCCLLFPQQTLVLRVSFRNNGVIYFHQNQHARFLFGSPLFQMPPFVFFLECQSSHNGRFITNFKREFELEKISQIAPSKSTAFLLMSVGVLFDALSSLQEQ